MKILSKAARVCLVIMLMTSWTGCGGSGGGGESDANAQSAQVMAVVDQENEDATEFASQAISYFDAVEEYLKLIEDETGGIDLSGMTVDDLVNSSYILRIAIPRDITSHLNKKEFRYSLRTGSLGVAKFRAAGI